MIFYNNGLKRGWYYHQVAGKCDNCDKGFNESGGVLNGNVDIPQILCIDCYHIINYQTEQNKKWIREEYRIK
jgi:hypothetical protein